MELRVLGCHGGSSLDHRSVCFLVDGRVALDAGSLSTGLTIAEQGGVELVLATHSHMDHIGELGAVCDVRAQQDRARLVVASTSETIEALRKYFFNDVLWPDFSRIPDPATPTLEFRQLESEESVQLLHLTVRPIMVDHSVPSCGFIIEDDHSAIAYSGDTGPTERFWEVLNDVPKLRALITEVSYPDRLGDLALRSGHLTPTTFRQQLQKLYRAEDLPILVYGMKPVFVEEITATLNGFADGNLRLLATGDRLEL